MKVNKHGYKQSAEPGDADGLGREKSTNSLLWETQQKGGISHEAASYLDQVGKKVAYDLEKGPVFIGEQHSLINAQLVIDKLIGEKKVNRLVVEVPPASTWVKPEVLKKINKQLAKHGYTSIDAYLSSFSEQDMQSGLHKKIHDQLKDVPGWQIFPRTLLSRAMKAGVHVDFIDAPRQQTVRGIDGVSMRNDYMAAKFNGDPKYSEPGVLGIFGSDHLRTALGVKGEVLPALQQMVALSEGKVFQTAPVFKDVQTGNEYFDWSKLADGKAHATEMSIAAPYKVKTIQGRPLVKDGAVVHVAPDIMRRVIINAAGSEANSVVQKYKDKHPSTTTVFEALPNGNIKYVSGYGTDLQTGTRAKGYILTGSDPLPVHPNTLLKRANEKLDSRGLQFEAKLIAVNDVAHNQLLGSDSGSAREDTQQKNLIWEAQQKSVISHEAASYLEQVKSKAAHQLKTEPVFIGEAHDSHNATLLIEQLIAEQKVRRLLLEREPVKDFMDPAQLKHLNDELASYGYSSVDEFLSNFTPSDKKSPIYKKVKNAVVAASEHEYNSSFTPMLTAAAKAGVNIDFVDGGRDPTLKNSARYNARHNYIGNKLSSDPKYSAAGVVGLFGAEHLRIRLDANNKIAPALQQVVKLPETNVFQTTPVFLDAQSGEEHFAWGDLSVSTHRFAKTSKNYPFVAKEKFSSGDGEFVYSQPEIKRRVIINAAGQSADSTINKITSKYPSSSIVFDALKDGSLRYASGTDSDIAGGRRVKAYIVAGSDGLPLISPMLLERAKNKLGIYDVSFTTKHIAIGENEASQGSRIASLNKPVGMTDNRTNALPASTVVKSQEQVVAGGLVGKTTPSAIDQATAVPVKAGPSEESDFDVFRDQGMINADTAKFLDKARKEIGKQLATGPVLIGEQNSELNAPLLISQLISDRAVKKLVVELPPLDDQLKKIQGGTELLKAIRKQGYKSGEDFLNNAPLVNRDGSTNKTLQLLLEAITYNGDPAKQNRSVSGDLVREAVLAGVKVHYVAQPTEAGKTPASINSRNKYMAQKIKKLGGLDAPGTVGLFDAEQLKQQLKGTGIKPGLQKRIGLAESRTYDLSPAVSTAERGGIVARWEELGRDTQASVPERISSLFPFELDTSKKPSFFGGKRYYKATSAEPSQTAATRF